MPKQSTSLTEAEIKAACAFWITKGCPSPDRKYRAHLALDRPAHPSPNDPGQGFTATVWFDDVENERL